MDDKKKKISISTGCYNEEGNLQEFYNQLLKVLGQFPQYDYEIIIADDCSTDGSRDILRRIAVKDKKFKVILNSNNFGQPRSSHNGFLQTTGDAVVTIASDLQEPPELIADFIRKWEEGYNVVAAIKSRSKENPIMFIIIGLL